MSPRRPPAFPALAGATFFKAGLFNIAEIQDAYKLLEPLLGHKVAPIAFAVALIAAGQSSTITGTLAGQVVMEGFVHIRMRPLIRRLLTRALAIIPAVVTIVFKIGRLPFGVETCVMHSARLRDW